MGCRRERPKQELIRVALAAHEPAAGEAPRPRLAVLDSDGRLGGRGAYLCRAGGSARPRAECLAEAMRRNGFARALRAQVTLDHKLVESVSR